MRRRLRDLVDWFANKYVGKMIRLGIFLILVGLAIAYVYTDSLEVELAQYKRMYEQSEKEKWSLLMKHNKQNNALREKSQTTQ